MGAGVTSVLLLKLKIEQIDMLFFKFQLIFYKEQKVLRLWYPAWTSTMCLGPEPEGSHPNGRHEKRLHPIFTNSCPFSIDPHSPPQEGAPNKPKPKPPKTQGGVILDPKPCAV